MDKPGSYQYDRNGIKIYDGKPSVEMFGYDFDDTFLEEETKEEDATVLDGEETK